MPHGESAGLGINAEVANLLMALLVGGVLIAWALDWLILDSGTPKVIVFGVVTMLGLVVAAFAQVLLARSSVWKGFSSTQDTALYLVGEAGMAVGGATALLGCAIGQGLSGLFTLGLTSAIAVVGIGLCAVIGLRLQNWLMEPE